MPAPAGTKRIKGLQITRPFVFGSIARPIDPNKKPPNLPAEHTHQWTVFVKGVDDVDISYWLKKVQFKLHETYANALRTIDGPPFEVTETGWGEFEVQIKLHIISEANEKPAILWHALKLHPYGENAEQQRERREPIISQNYEEIMFADPTEQFYDIMTGGGPQQQASKGKGTGKGSKQAAYARGGGGGDGGRTSEIPVKESPGNPYSQDTEAKELDRLKEAIKQVDQMVLKERVTLAERERVLEEAKKVEGLQVKKK
ncbi:MAG: NuA4 histone H4 acetyltransferase complex and the SWR1 complex subunit [Pycnora praestabilis]|nr:MAG: NuA4 histone H4 acetyltransferase complex and the SWR1 complex subunit [Pycnora praestabilis]